MCVFVRIYEFVNHRYPFHSHSRKHYLPRFSFPVNNNLSPLPSLDIEDTVSCSESLSLSLSHTLSLSLSVSLPLSRSLRLSRSLSLFLILFLPLSFSPFVFAPLSISPFSPLYLSRCLSRCLSLFLSLSFTAYSGVFRILHCFQRGTTRCASYPAVS